MTLLMSQHHWIYKKSVLFTAITHKEFIVKICNKNTPYLR